jgi:protein-S-isoprenylcysteine O-methyltransferase Ste14
MRSSIRLRLFLTRGMGLVVVLLVSMSASTWSAPELRRFGDGMFAAGVVLALAGFGGRLWAVRHIGGRKKQELVRTGPYSVCRHPLYLCSLVGGLGLALCTQRLSVTLFYLAANALLLPLAIRSEERFLEHNFAGYAEYRATVPALLPRWRLLAGGRAGTVNGRALWRGTLEGACQLLPVLLLPLLEEAQMAGVLPVLFALP